MYNSVKMNSELAGLKYIILYGKSKSERFNYVFKAVEWEVSD